MVIEVIDATVVDAVVTSDLPIPVTAPAPGCGVVGNVGLVTVTGAAMVTGAGRETGTGTEAKSGTETLTGPWTVIGAWTVTWSAPAGLTRRLIRTVAKMTPVIPAPIMSAIRRSQRCGRSASTVGPAAAGWCPHTTHDYITQSDG